ncbi:MAG TPA: hypothetical protein PLP34_04780 [Chitinophagaceae bacterium]|nr:hypothetical protein [Chitinophagaceae bacterium]HNF71705.1 hypothetical protein [Chitinophagaceae bacterium]
MKKVKLIAVLCCVLGTTTLCMAQAKTESPKKNFGRNILSFEPVHLITNDFVGVGFAYERLANPYLGIKVPVMIAINNDYFNVGIEAKLYPTRNDAAVRYAIAPTLMAGIGTNSYQTSYYDWQTGNTITKNITEEASHVGFLLNQTLNVTITRQFFIGLDGGLGLNYYDEAANNANQNTKLSFLAQLHASMGFRF